MVNPIEIRPNKRAYFEFNRQLNSMFSSEFVPKKHMLIYSQNCFSAPQQKRSIS